MALKILGKKPSEVRKAIAAFASAVLVLAVALPIVGVPAGVTAVVAGVVGVAGYVVTYFTNANVAAVIDSADNL